MKLICEYSYQILRKTICCHSKIDSVKFDVILIDISRIYMHIWVHGQEEGYCKKGIKILY